MTETRPSWNSTPGSAGARPRNRSCAPLEMFDALGTAYDAGHRAGAEEERAAMVSYTRCAIDCSSEECESCPIYRSLAEDFEQGAHRSKP